MNSLYKDYERLEMNKIVYQKRTKIRKYCYKNEENDNNSKLCYANNWSYVETVEYMV